MTSVEPVRIGKGLLLHPLPWILLLGLLLRLSASGYIRFSDDADYMGGALALLRDEKGVPVNNHTSRLGMILPTAASLWMFGVSYGAGLVWPMAASLLSIAATWALARRVGASTGLSAVFTAVSTQHVLSGGELFPDSPVALWLILALLGYLRASDPTCRRPVLNYALGGAAFGLGWATRADLLKLAPVIFVLEFLQWRRRGFDRRFLAFPSVMASILAMNWIGLWVLSGDPWVHLRMETRTVAGWVDSPASRFTGAVPMVKSLVSPFGAFGILFLPAAAGVILGYKEGRSRPAVLAFLILLGTTLVLAITHSLGDGRFFTPLAPFVAIMAAQALSQVPSKPRSGTVVGMIVLSIVCAHTRFPSRNVDALGEVAALLRKEGGAAYSDRRTASMLGYYFTVPPIRLLGMDPLERRSLLIRNGPVLDMDSALYGLKPFDFDSMRGRIVLERKVKRGGWPGFREGSGKLLRLKGVLDPDFTGFITVYLVAAG